MDYKKFIDRAKEKGIDEIQISINRNVNDSMNVFNEEVKSIESSDIETFFITFLINNKKSTFYFENDDFDIDAVIDKAILNANNIDSEEINLLSDNKKKYPIKAMSLFNIDNSKNKEMLFELNKYAKLLDDRIINVELDLDFRNNEYRLVNSLNLDVLHKNQNCSLSVEITVEQDGIQYNDSKNFFANDLNDIDMKKVVKECVEEAVFKIGGESIKSNEYEIILSKKATSQMLRTMMGAFFAKSVNQDKSPLKGKLNEKIISSKLTLIEDPNNENRVFYRYFDNEGVETKYKEIVKNGVLKTYLYDLKNAYKECVESTGNGGKSYINIFFEPGNSSLEDMVEDTKKGILITSLEGLHSGFNTINGDFSLQTKGKYIENGKIVKPITLMVVSGNFFDMFNNVTMVGNEVDFNADTLSVGGIDLKIKSLTVSGK